MYSKIKKAGIKKIAHAAHLIPNGQMFISGQVPE